MSTGDGPVEVPAVQQVPGLGGNTYIHLGSTGGLEFPSEVGSMQAMVKSARPPGV